MAAAITCLCAGTSTVRSVISQHESNSTLAIASDRRFLDAIATLIATTRKLTPHMPATFAMPIWMG
jgi:hypothetical protein